MKNNNLQEEKISANYALDIINAQYERQHARLTVFLIALIVLLVTSNAFWIIKTFMW